VGEPAGLIARIRQIRRATTAEHPAQARPADREQIHLSAVEARVAYLENLVQGLQDSVHRESSRQSRRVAEIEARIQPAALGKALSQDLRARGL
jgi:hypothetical protein